MKLRISIFILFALLAGHSCKRSKTEIKPEKPVGNLAAHCYNGMLDQDETFIDCGGECGACTQAQNQCNPADNTLSYNNSNFIFTSVGRISSWRLILQGQFNGGSIIVRFTTQTPNEGVIYKVAQFAIDDDEAEVMPNLNNKYTNCTSGNVYVKLNGGKYTVTVCGATDGILTPVSSKIVE
jgi:hypothetical protein